MQKTIQTILRNELKEDIQSIKEIVGLGSVNKIFDIKGNGGEYILRLNEEADKKIEYQKEKWCLDKVLSLGIPTATVVNIGVEQNLPYMIQEKITGVNGQFYNATDKLTIWNTLGKYAKKYHQVKQIEQQEVTQNEFHKNWQARLAYNIKELNEKDSLLKQAILTPKEQQLSRTALMRLKDKAFQVGLVHGDLCPRNVICSKTAIYLLDWGTAEINVVPHVEIGILLMSEEAKGEAFANFLEGLEISKIEYDSILPEIKLLNYLHRLDKYRWAETYDIEQIEIYEKKVRDTFEELEIS